MGILKVALHSPCSFTSPCRGKITAKAQSGSASPLSLFARLNGSLSAQLPSQRSKNSLHQVMGEPVTASCLDVFFPQKLLPIALLVDFKRAGGEKLNRKLKILSVVKISV